MLCVCFKCEENNEATSNMYTSNNGHQNRHTKYSRAFVGVSGGGGIVAFILL